MTIDASAEVLVALCTYRRPGVADTLQSLAGLARCGLRVRVAVADNDETPSARARIEAVAAEHPLSITYLHAPASNISIARNALLDHARQSGVRLIAWLDDDEVAEPHWLAELVAAWRERSVSAVLGPVRADYLPGAPRWMDRARAHDTLPVIHTDGGITTGYTCNALVDLADPAVTGLRFDLARGRSGVEDSAFFSEIHTRGGTIGFAPRALVREVVPESRARLGWLLQRRYRMGQTHASLVVRDRGTLGRLQAAALATAKAGACGAMALAGLFQPAFRNRQIMRAALHLGAASLIGGAREIQHYGHAPPGPNAIDHKDS